MGTSWLLDQVALPPDMTWSICGPMISQISAQTWRAGWPMAEGWRSGPIETR